MFLVTSNRLFIITILVIPYSHSNTSHLRLTNNFENAWVLRLTGSVMDLKRMAPLEKFYVVNEIDLSIGLFVIEFEKQVIKNGKKRKNLIKRLLKYEMVIWTEQMTISTDTLKLNFDQLKSWNENLFPDKYYNKQWYLQDYRTTDSNILMHINVIHVWYKYKIFGKNVVVIIVDDGLEFTHPELADNYDPEYDKDFCDGNKLPEPRDIVAGISHGSVCGGIIGMRAGNQLCGVGIAPLITLGVVRYLRGEKIYQVLTFKYKDVDIMNCSWGPWDDGQTMQELDSMRKLGFKDGISKGRRGKGIIYVFPAGGGKANHDTCGYDQYANSIYTITVGGISYDGSQSYDTERCASIMVSVFTGDLKGVHKIITTSVADSCFLTAAGSSCGPPFISGVISLILETNGNLTWREVQHIFPWTCQVAPLAHNRVWRRNAAGFFYSLDFGFGMVDALKAVELAKIMRPIPPMNTCVIKSLKKFKGKFNGLKALQIRLFSNGCKQSPSEVNYIEHIQLLVNVKYKKRGDIQIYMKSPAGTRSQLLEPRKYDFDESGLNNWILDTVHFWGENPDGQWEIGVYDETSKKFHTGFVGSFALIIHGTRMKPPHYIHQRTYYKFDQDHALES